MNAPVSYAESKLPLLLGVLFVIGLIAPFAVYPTFLMKILCYALFACAFNLLLGTLTVAVAILGPMFA